MCESIRPGMTVRPARSTTRVPLPASARISAERPTAMILPSRTASASATGAAASSVTILPLSRTVSASCACAGKPSAAAARASIAAIAIFIADPPNAFSLFLHRPPLDLQQAIEAGRGHRGLHFLFDIALADEGIDLALRQALVGLAHGLDHGGKRGAGGGGEPEAERGEVALLEREFGKAVRWGEGHEGRGQPLADDAKLLGVTGEHE